jgi:hypothetical protein
MEPVLEWVLWVSSALFGLSVLALAAMMLVGRWRLAVHQRKENRRRAVLHDDLGLEASRHQQPGGEN